MTTRGTPDGARKENIQWEGSSQLEKCKSSTALTKLNETTKGRGSGGLDYGIIIPHGSRPGFLAWGASVNVA